MSEPNLSCMGRLDFLLGQTVYDTTGNAESNSADVPDPLPTSNGYYVIESALIVVDDESAAANSTRIWPTAAPPAAGNVGLALIVPSNTPKGHGVLAAATRILPPGQLGPAVEVICRDGVGTPAGTGFVSWWSLNTSRKVIIPTGYVLRVYFSDPGDLNPHIVTVDFLAQARWFDS